MAMPQWQGPVIGMHFRATVGEMGRRMNRVFVPDFEERCIALRDQYIDTALSVARNAGYDNPAFFVTSDDAEFVSYVKAKLPNASQLRHDCRNGRIIHLSTISG